MRSAPGSLDSVKVLVDAGADTRAKDKVYGGTPLGWAEHYVGEARDDESRARQAAIAEI